MYKIALALMLLPFCYSKGYAFECRKAKWSYKREQSPRDIHAIFKLNTFETNMRYLMFEVSQKKRSELEKLLFRYLIVHAKNDDVSSFFKAMEWIRLANGNKTRVIEQSNFCSLYKKTMALK